MGKVHCETGLQVHFTEANMEVTQDRRHQMSIATSSDAATLSQNEQTDNTAEGEDNNAPLEPEKEVHVVTHKIVCRYGRGCTHCDPLHNERFWHPSVAEISDEQIRTHYICNECGQAASSLQELQVHLQRKTAWSNASLVRCKISCLVDNKEWHEAHVSRHFGNNNRSYPLPPISHP